MESKKVILAINPALYTLVKQKAEKDYMNVQQYIYDLLRKNVLRPSADPTKKSHAGRPKTKSGDDAFIDMFTRSR